MTSYPGYGTGFGTGTEATSEVGYEPLLIKAGSTWRYAIGWEFKGERLGFEGYSARMQIRRTVFDPEVLAELRTGDGTITVGVDDDDLPVLLLRLGADKTKVLPHTVPHGPALAYDLELTDLADPTEVVPLLEGPVEVVPNVTRDPADPTP